jgi:ABC-type phosphate transport system substrate-binding protein
MLAVLLRIVFTAILTIPAVPPAGDVVLIARREPGESVTPRTAARLFLKEKLFWSDGTRIVPVNLPPDHEARDLFNRSVLRRSHRELVAFWNEEHFKGVNPPVVLESEDAVKAFVRQVDGAVGYIRRDRLEPDLKVLLVVSGP